MQAFLVGLGHSKAVSPLGGKGEGAGLCAYQGGPVQQSIKFGLIKFFNLGKDCLESGELSIIYMYGNILGAHQFGAAEVSVGTGGDDITQGIFRHGGNKQVHLGFGLRNGKMVYMSKVFVKFGHQGRAICRGGRN